MSNYKVKKYQKKDLPGVLKAFRDGFAHLLKNKKQYNKKDQKLYTKLIKILISISNIRLVATKNKKPLGYLGGTIPNKPTKPNPKQTQKLTKYYLKNLPHLNTKKQLWNTLFKSIQYALHYNNKKPTIDFLTSQKKARGGIGTTLVNKYVKIIKNTKYNKITVNTDQTVNYKFYKKYGFKKTKQYNLIQNIFTKPTKIKAYTYQYKIKKQT